MVAPKARTKMTRSNWSRHKRPKTKGADLARSQNVTVMSRYGGKSIARYATTYMSRDNAAVPPVEDVGVQAHDVGTEVDAAGVAESDISRESMGAKRERRLFDETANGLTHEELVKKVQAFNEAQKKGHTPIIQVVSFSQAYLREQQILADGFTDEKGHLTQSLDDAKLRLAIRDSVTKMAEQAGFSKLEYVAAIHGNTQHPHVHLAMIETDDDATGRLAAREPNNQLDDDVEDEKVIGKSPAALAYDRKHKVNTTVERGMMRQSELDYFRQEIDHSLTNMSSLVNVRDLEYQQTYAATVNLDVLRQGYHDKKFVKDFTKIALSLQKPVKEDTPVVDALDRRVEKLSRELLSGKDFGQTKFMEMQYKLGTKLSTEKALETAVFVHSGEIPSAETVADYETMGLKPTQYNGVVLTPSEFADANPDLDASYYTSYVDRYKGFIEKPSVTQLDGLVLRVPDEMDVTEDVRHFVAQQDQALVNTTKAAVYKLLANVNETDTTPQAIETALTRSLKNVRSNQLELSDDDTQTEVKAFQKRLHAVGVQHPLIDNRLSKVIVDAESARQIDTVPVEITQAKHLLKQTYQENIQDLDRMFVSSQGKHLPREDREALLESNRNLREVTLGTGELTEAGSMLHAALSSEIYNTGTLERVHKLKLGDRESLFEGYREYTLGKLTAITAAVDDLNKGVSFSEPAMQQSMRTELTNTLTEMSDGYATKLEYVDKVAEIAKLPEPDERAAVAQLMLAQVMWRQGMDEGLASADIEKRIKATAELSTEDKLATAMTLTLNELDTTIDMATERAEEIAATMKRDAQDSKAFDASKALQNEVNHLRLSQIPTTYAAVAEPPAADVMYDPAKYTLVVDDHRVVERDTLVRPLRDAENLSLGVAVKLYGQAERPKNSQINDLEALEKERRDSQRLSYKDMVVVDKVITATYAVNTEKELYHDQQRLGNVNDAELVSNLAALDTYEMTMQRAEPQVKKPKVVEDVKQKAAAAEVAQTQEVLHEQTVERTHVRRNNIDKGRAR